MLVCIVASRVLNFAVPLIVKEVIDGILPFIGEKAGSEGSFAASGVFSFIFKPLYQFSRWLAEITGANIAYAALGVFSLAIVVATLLGGVFGYALRYIAQYIAQKSEYSLRNDLYRSLMRQSFSFFDKSRTGQLMARATGDIREIQRFLGWGLRQMIDTALIFSLAFVIMVVMHWRLTILSLASTPLIALIISRYAKKIGPVWETIRKQYGTLTSVLQENLTGVRVVKGFAMEDYEKGKFSRENQEYFERMLTRTRLRAFYFPLSNFVAGVNITLILWYGGMEVITGHLSLGTWFAFNLYVLQLLWPIRFAGFMIGFYKRASAAAKRVFEVIDERLEIVDKENAVELEDIQGHVRFENVWFGYDKDNMVLKNVNLEVKPGETVAILGATGSGKSSIINLVPRFYDVTSGKITIDDQDIRNATRASLRKHIAIVRQEPFIFSTTLKDNIAYGKKGAKMEEVVEAARAAKIHEFISSLPKGYETEVGERGVTLSGGEKQRIAIARALLTNPRIIIFDASTSSVDIETEYEIQRALETLFKNRTTFIITQRLSTIRNADKIVVLDKGDIVEEGTHEELMVKKGRYYRLYQTQLGEQKGEAVSARGGD